MYLFICPSVIHPFVSLPACLPLYLPVCLFIRVSVHIPVIFTFLAQMLTLDIMAMKESGTDLQV